MNQRDDALLWALVGFMAGIILMAAITLAIPSSPPDLGGGCRIFLDGGAICEDENSSWYFEEGTFR